MRWACTCARGPASTSPSASSTCTRTIRRTCGEQQLERLRELQAACIATFREFLIEVIPPADMPSDATTVARALEQIYAADVVPDWWKLPPSTNEACWDAITQVIRRNDPHCRGVLLLGLEASEEDLQRGFSVAARFALVKGFAVGRSIFADMAAAWFAGDMPDADVIAGVAQRYRAVDRAVAGRSRQRRSGSPRRHERASDAAREYECNVDSSNRQDGAKSVSPPTSVG